MPEKMARCSRKLSTLLTRTGSPRSTHLSSAPGFIRTELWRDGDGIYLTADHCESVEAFERFQAGQGDQYRRLDAKLEGIAGIETFLGGYDLVD